MTIYFDIGKTPFKNQAHKAMGHFGICYLFYWNVLLVYDGYNKGEYCNENSYNGDTSYNNFRNYNGQ